MGLRSSKSTEYRQLPEFQWVACLVCPKKNDSLLSMHKKHVSKHSQGQIHQRHLSYARQAQHQSLPLPGFDDTSIEIDEQPDGLFDFGDVVDDDVDIHIDEPGGLPLKTPDACPVDHPLSIGDLWNPISAERTFEVGGERVDYYAEALRSLESGEKLFSLAPPMSEEPVIEEYDENFGIEVPRMYITSILYNLTDCSALDTLPSRSSRSRQTMFVPIDSPSYPWPSAAVC